MLVAAAERKHLLGPVAELAEHNVYLGQKTLGAGQDGAQGLGSKGALGHYHTHFQNFRGLGPECLLAFRFGSVVAGVCRGVGTKIG
ncbi:hypothetical protein IscW_ISCW002620 [Ixodes scapularis]|uniref:Uncharacterized protein n=1 Tax=Ixodes scapularis TaxID=6945 RepID=B7PDP3_IXOSC|nr:hypothetical protein IscW_ISCW002620 [Ixodes scapularis]|eukprot:XP_002410987.1 hypothetical protein IscW_ISCW002620 [Ixodes scapularis]